MTEETNLTTSAETNASPIAATPEASPPSIAPAAPADPESAMDAALSETYDRLNAPPEAVADKNADKPDDASGEPVEAIAAPASWSAEKREIWASLPRTAQEYVAQREADAHKRISQMGQELSKYRPLAGIADLQAKTQGVFDRNGLTFEQGLQRLVYAQQVLESNPLQGLAAIAQSYGINLAEVFSGANGNSAVDPRIAGLQRELDQTKALITRQQREQTAAQMRAKREQEAWATETVSKWSEGKEFLDSVRETMQRMLQSGMAADLDDAYDKAIRMNPEIHAQMETRRQAEAKRLEREERERAVKDAKRAVKLNTGNKPAIPKPKGKWDDDAWLGQVYDAANG